MELLTW